MKTKNSVWYEYCIYAAICMDTHTHTHFFMWMIKYFTVYKNTTGGNPGKILQ